MVYLNGRPTTYTLKDGLSSYNTQTRVQDGQGNLWLGTEDGGINKFRDGKFTVYRKKDGLPSDNIRISAACEDRRGALWFAVYQAGLYRLKDGKLTQYTEADGLTGSAIEVIYEDREGSIWIGTSDAGLSRLRENVVSARSTSDGLSGDNIYPILEGRSGEVWVGAWFGLNQFRDGNFLRRSDLRPLRDSAISSLYEDSEGALWVGTYGKGVFRLKDGALTPVKGSQTGANGWLAIAQDRAGAFWFGTTEGLFKYDQGALTRFTTEDGLPNIQINTIFYGLHREGRAFGQSRAVVLPG